MSILDRLFRRKPTAKEQADVAEEYRVMTEAVSRETPEQKTRFYLEVAAIMGNKSAAEQLAKMGPDPEKTRPN